MAISKIDISKGVFKTQDNRSLLNSPFAEELINLFVDRAGANYDRPALADFLELESSNIIGLYYFKSFVIAVTFNRNIYSIDLDFLNTITDITGVTLPGGGTPVFTDDGSTVYIVGGGVPIKWAGSGVTALLGGNPPEMTHIVYSDGYLIGNRRLTSEGNKVVQYSDFEEPETWPALNIFSAIGDPDPIQGIVTSQREIYVVGEKTVELWQNVGTFPVPFSRAYVYQFGTPAPYSVHSVDNSVFFFDRSKRIMRISGREISRISEAIEDELANYDVVDDCVSFSFGWDGSIHVMFVFPSEGKVWSVDLKNMQWTQWFGYDNGLDRVRLNSLVYLEDRNKVFAGDFFSGNLWQFSATEKTDANSVFVRRRTFSYRDGGGSVRKRAKWLRANMKMNVAKSYEGAAELSNPILELRWKDDANLWSEWQQLNLGVKGTQDHYAVFRRLGIYKNRQYQLQMTDPAEFNMISIETDEDVMIR